MSSIPLFNKSNNGAAILPARDTISVVAPFSRVAADAEAGAEAN